jgi:hypothetical protein
MIEARRDSGDQPPGASIELCQVLVESIHDHGMFLVTSQGEIQTWNVGARRLGDLDTT